MTTQTLADPPANEGAALPSRGSETSSTSTSTSTPAASGTPAVSPSVSPSAAPGKPLLRGVSHQIGFFVAIAATAVLVTRTHAASAAQAALVFGASLSVLLGTSALYHRVDWSTLARQRMRRMDHAAIFLLIAGGYTPILSLIPAADGSHGALVTIWLAAGVGIVKSLAWAHAPKWLTALVCVVIGWMAIGPVMERSAVVGSSCIGVLIAAGITYSLGAVVYAVKRPDPFPRVFGYHEIFHALVLVASGFLFAHVTLVIRAVAG